MGNLNSNLFAYHNHGSAGMKSRTLISLELNSEPFEHPLIYQGIYRISIFIATAIMPPISLRTTLLPPKNYGCDAL